MKLKTGMPGHYKHHLNDMRAWANTDSEQLQMCYRHLANKSIYITARQK